MEQLREGFHAAAGWYFRRAADASVTIWAESGAEVVLDPSTWASVVAGVSRHGEGDEAYHAALAFHGSQDAPMS